MKADSCPICGYQTYVCGSIRHCNLCGWYEHLNRDNGFKRLDVGCGNIATGDVNVDLFIRDCLNHRGQDDADIQVHSIRNFIVCDAENLPFKNGCFETVYSRGLIEHVQHPLKLFHELTRVSSSKVVVEVPHWLGDALTIKRKRWNRTHHINRFNQRWFKEAARLAGFTMIRCYDFTFVYLPHRFFPLFRFPWEFGVELIRND